MAPAEGVPERVFDHLVGHGVRVDPVRAFTDPFLDLFDPLFASGALLFRRPIAPVAAVAARFAQYRRPLDGRSVAGRSF